MRRDKQISRSIFPTYFQGEMEKEDFAKLSGFSRRTEWRAQSAMTLTKGS